VSGVLQITDGLSGDVVLDLNKRLSGQGGLIQRDHVLAEGQLAGFAQGEAQWSPLAGPAALGRRQIRVPVTLWEQTPDLLGERIAKLMQATSQPWWLRTQRHGASRSSWLRCFPCVPAIETVISATNSAPMVRGVISCETDPYAIGGPVTGLPTEIDMHPGASHIAWARSILNVPGDALTPLLVRLHDPEAFSTAMGAFVSVRRRQTPTDVVSSKLIREAESGLNERVGVAGKLTFTTLTADAALSSSGGVRATFSSTYEGGTSASITFAEPTLTGPNAPGTYRMFLRIRRNGVANDQQLVLRAFTNNSNHAPDEVVVPLGGADTRLVDMGLVQWPSAQPQTIMAPVLTPSNADATPVTIQMWRKSDGAATVDLDYLCWIPADEDSGYLETDHALLNPATQYVNIDGYSGQAVLTSSSPDGAHTIVGQAYGANTPTPRFIGGAPKVRPGDNVLYIVGGTSAGAVWPRDRKLTVEYTYWPRFTWLR
jgi:hypothetical protein